MGNVYIFSHFGTHSEYLTQFFEVIIRADAMHNPIEFLFWDVYRNFVMSGCHRNTLVRANKCVMCFFIMLLLNNLLSCYSIKILN